MTYHYINLQVDDEAADHPPPGPAAAFQPGIAQMTLGPGQNIPPGVTGVTGTATFRLPSGDGEITNFIGINTIPQFNALLMTKNFAWTGNLIFNQQGTYYVTVRYTKKCCPVQSTFVVRDTDSFLFSLPCASTMRNITLTVLAAN